MPKRKSKSKRTPSSEPMTCFCGRGHQYEECCKPFHQGDDYPADAETLMRSRYSAYACLDDTYLRKTWASQTRPSDLTLDASTNWIGQKIVNTNSGGAKDTTGTVEFVATYKAGGKAYKLSENSQFIREDGRWVYLAAL